MRKGLGVLQQRRQLVWFGLGLFGVLFVLFLSVSLFASSLVEDLRPSPHLSAKIAWVAFGGKVSTTAIPNGPNSDDNQNSKILLAIQVKNRGSYPTIASNWSLDVFSNGHQYKGVPVVLPKVISITTHGRSMQYTGQDALYEKTLSPILPGSMVTGLLMFDLGDVNMDSINSSLPKFEVSFSDVNDVQYSTAYQSTGNEGPPVFLPGLTQSP